MTLGINFSKLMEFSFKLIFIISISFSLAIIINSYISYKFFELDKTVKIKHQKQLISSEPQYTYLNYIFQKYQPQSDQTIKLVSTKKGETIQTSPQALNLNIKLIGTAISRNEKVAFIQDKDGLKIIKIGDNLGNYKVKKIDKYSLILTDGINDYYLSINIGKSKSKSYSVKRTYTPYKTHHTPISSKGDHYEISKREVEKQTEDLGKLLRYVRIIPVVRNGETKGYKFAYVSPRSILYKYGLRSGDLIISVNGMPIRTAEEAFKIYNMLRNEKTIRLEVERRGERKVITYEIK